MRGQEGESSTPQEMVEGELRLRGRGPGHLEPRGQGRELSGRGSWASPRRNRMAWAEVGLDSENSEQPHVRVELCLSLPPKDVEALTPSTCEGEFLHLFLYLAASGLGCGTRVCCRAWAPEHAGSAAGARA